MKLTRKFSLRSVNGNTAIFILYDWASNAILANPIKDAKNYTMVKAFTKNVKYLSACGVKPEYNIMDNVASKEIRNYLSKDKIKLKLVEPHNYRANTSKRAIQTFKNHLSLAHSLAKKCPPLSYGDTSSRRHRIPWIWCEHLTYTPRYLHTTSSNVPTISIDILEPPQQPEASYSIPLKREDHGTQEH